MSFVNSLMFGFSTHFFASITARFLLGLLNPIVGTCRTVITEIATKQYESLSIGIMYFDIYWFIMMV